MINDIQLNNVTNASDKTRDLILSIVLDLIGMATFLIPVLGEFSDILWAPISGYLLTRIYKGTTGKMVGIFAFLEELIPFTDFIPTYTLIWIYTYIIKKKNQNKGVN